MEILFQNANIYSSSDKKFYTGDLLVRDGKIASVGTGLTAVACDAEIVDCTGKYLLPGLVDGHTHGRNCHDFDHTDEAGINHMREEYAKIGTTTVMATLASQPLDVLYKAADMINNNREVTPGKATIAGIHMEGRYLSEAKRGAHAIPLLAPLSPEELKALLNKLLPLPIHLSAAFELDEDQAFLKTALGMGVTCSMAHTDSTFEQASAAVEGGVKSFTHTFNAMSAIHHRKPGTTTAALLLDDAYAEFICDGEHLHPAIVKMASRMKPADKMLLITDSMEAAGAGDGKYSIAGLDVFVKNGRAVNEEGSLAGSTLNLFDGVRNCMKFTGKTLEEVLPYASANPAAMLGISHQCGALEVGLRADILLVSNKEDPVLEGVWAAGGRCK